MLAATPPGATHDGLARAAALGDRGPRAAAAVLGCGRKVIASDTVPFALWSASRHLDEDYPTAVWRTVVALGDMDTTAAIVGGVVALAVGREGLPADWLARREPLPDAIAASRRLWRSARGRGHHDSVGCGRGAVRADSIGNPLSWRVADRCLAESRY